MSRCMIKTSLLAVLTLSLLGTGNALGSVVSYTGSLCKNYANYQIWVPPGQTISTIETNLYKEGITDQFLSSLPPTCLNAFMEYTCSANFPRAGPSSTPNATDILFACKSTCQRAVTQCSSIFSTAGKQNLIPNCDGPITDTVQTLPPNGTLFLPDGSCNNVVSKKNITDAAIGVAGKIVIMCPAPFIPDPMQGPNGSSSNPSVCNSGCCLPCPAQAALYRTGAMDKLYRITEGVRATSAILISILVISYIFLPEKRAHPSSLVFYNLTCAFFYSIVVIFPLVNRKGLQCVDSVTPSTQHNNLTCAIQGSILIFASVGCAIWCTAIIINLHLHVVWNNPWFAKNTLLVNIFCWGYAIAVMAVALGLGQVQWDNSSYCLISSESSSAIFFYPLAAIVYPSFLVHVCTFVYIARITMQHSTTDPSTSGSRSDPSRQISHRRHVINTIRLQWRAASLAVFALTVVIFYWLFYFIQLKKTQPDILQPNIQKYFVSCLVNGGDQDTCADQLAPYLPPYALVMFAEISVSSVGIFSFIIFFRPALVREWREFFGSLTSSKLKRQKDEHEFVEM